MKNKLSLIVKIAAIVWPIIEEVIIAIKAINLLKRAMRQEWDSTRLVPALNKYFNNNYKQVEVAVAAILVAIHEVDVEFYNAERSNPAVITIIHFLRKLKDMPRHQRRMILRELARTLVIKRNPDRVFNDAELDTALQVGYSMVGDEKES